MLRLLLLLLLLLFVAVAVAAAVTMLLLLYAVVAAAPCSAVSRCKSPELIIDCHRHFDVGKSKIVLLMLVLCTTATTINCTAVIHTSYIPSTCSC